MSKILTDNKYYSQIADVIREQNGTSNTYTPPQMVSALKDLFYEEAEGVPPISFNGIGENLLDYRIDGASGGVGDRTGNLFINVWFQGEINSSTGIMKTSSIFVCSDFIPITPLITYSCSRTVSREFNNLRCYDANKQYVGTGADNANTGNPLNNGVSFGTFMITNESVAYIRFNDKSNDLTTKYMLVEGEYTASTMPDYEPYGYKVPVVVNGKNLLQNNATSQTKNGVTFTVNEDKSISCNGTASSNAFFKIGDIQLKKNCIMSGCPEGGANNSYVMRLYNNGSVFKTDSGDGVLINSEIQNGYAEIRIAAGYTCDNLTFYPMIRLASIEDDTYETYIEETTNIYLDNPIRTINDEIEYIDYSEQKQHRVRKNLLQNTATTQTINGVTFTVNNDKSITCNGTATGITAITINTIFSINSTKISGCPMGGSWSSFELDLLNINTNNVDVIDTGNGAVIQNENSYRVRIRIASGYTCNNLTFYPMIRKAEIEDDTYEPYIENTEVDVTLPAITTLDGTNTLTVDTEVQPSKVYVKARKESSYETAMRERYEEAQAQLDALESGVE